MLHDKNWVIVFRPLKGYGEPRKPEPITREKADTIRRFLMDKGARYVDLTDDNGNLKETIEKKEIVGVKRSDEQFDDGRGERMWICEHGKPQPMNQGMHTDKFGNREWKADCACVVPKVAATPW